MRFEDSDFFLYKKKTVLLNYRFLIILRALPHVPVIFSPQYSGDFLCSPVFGEMHQQNLPGLLQHHKKIHRRLRFYHIRLDMVYFFQKIHAPGIREIDIQKHKMEFFLADLINRISGCRGRIYQISCSFQKM